jgi:hypothetical protein
MARPIPLLSRYDPHERQASQAMPFLFQRKTGTNQEVISPATVVNTLRGTRRTPSWLPHCKRLTRVTRQVELGMPAIGTAR